MNLLQPFHKRLEPIGLFSGKHKKCINSEIFPSPEKNVGEKNQKCSESSEIPRKVNFRHFKKNAQYAYFMHILNFLGFF